jgi:mono/diheme cytochrome c family protein
VARFLRTRGGIFLLAGSLMFWVMACSDSSTGPEDAPDGHTVVKGGVAHAPGLNDPIANCASCHGADLRGGSGGQPSCFSCHGQKW